MTIKLRPNQVVPVQLGTEFFQKPNPGPHVMVMPTAFGKSIVIAAIARNCDDKFVILQPSKELLQQNFQKFLAMGGEASIYSASFNQKQIGKVTFATIGSIKEIGAAFKEKGVTKMIVDEAHLYPRNADSMMGQFLSESGISHVLGLTATPLKLQSMGSQYDSYSKLVMLTSRTKTVNFYKDILYVSQVSEMVEMGFWTPLKYDVEPVDTSGLVFNSTKADYTETSLIASFKANNIFERIIRKLNNLPERKSILVFVPSVHDANQLAKLIDGAAAVSGSTPPKERAEIIDAFKKGKLRVIFNVNVLSVGFDHPEVDCIICARSTASLAWYYQALGRGTRIAPGKKDCLIVDMSGNVEKFGPLEGFEIVKQGKTWKFFGADGVLLSGVRMDEIGIHTYDTEQSLIDLKEKQKQAEKEGGYIMPFGKHKGEPVAKIPKSYARWMLDTFQWDQRNEKLKKALESAMPILK